MTTLSFDDLLSSYRTLSDSERVKGSYFEQMTRQYLENDGVQASQYEQVWLWKDWPGRNGKPDTGIDLVAKREDGGVTAIQCKFYEESHSMQKKDIDSFMSASGKSPFSHRLIVSTTGNWSANAEEMLDGQQIPVQRIGLSDFRYSNIDWASYEITDPTTAPKLAEQKQLREHQHEALKRTMAGFASSDRGKLIMACGTGKTFTALKIAEQFAQNEGHARILFMVPSLALMSQSLKEWSDEASLPMHAYAVCSDNKVGRQKNADLTDVSIHDLQIPATTNGQALVTAMGSRALDEGMTVVFSTYQSIEAVSAAQKAGMPDFDLIICDEAHRTTGATLNNTDESNFVKVHSNSVIAASKRLYMTATPRIFNDAIKDAAREKDAVLCSMDDVELYGPVFYRIGFGEAVTRKLLTDYKVLVLGVDEAQATSAFQSQLADSSNELLIEDVAKLIGCWNGLAKRKAGALEAGFGDDPSPMRRAVAFNGSIKQSQTIAGEFEDLVRVHLANLDNEDPTDDLTVQVKHVDGSFNAVRRAERLDWLKADPGTTNPVCRILTNARCLTEGVDVPSLDAVLFLNPRNSMVDVIQAVGRVMRRYTDPATGIEKKFGYIVLPIAIPSGMSTSEALKDNQRYRVVWQVLQALRAHDDRMDTTINQIELNRNAPESIIIDTVDLTGAKKNSDQIGKKADEVGPTGDGNQSVQGQFVFPVDDWKDAVYAKIVDKCGTRMYWGDWAKDIANIAGKHITLIRTLLADAGEHREAFDEFVTGLQENLNPDIDDEQAIEMLAQHLVTKPVFDAMFTDANFTERNPVSVAMQGILAKLDTHAAFERERQGLEKFYESVRNRVAAIDNAEAKQKIILELYDKFFRAAFPRVADRLGIVFTPVPVVDYILRSADAALRLEFGKTLSDEGVSILEPFVGTGTFLTRLLQSGLIKAEDLNRKYTTELFANEIVLLSYYIAAINIETVYAEVAASAGVATTGAYSPFDGLALTDTFQLNEGDNRYDSQFFPENTKRVKRQKAQDIRVIVMNPPYSAGQTSGNDNNQNQKYPVLDLSIEKTYAKLSTGTNKNSLYDSYIRGIRWASNRIKDDGVIAFVSNGSFIDGNTADGIRKTFASEFSRIFVYNLRGNQRTSGEVSRKEGGKVFGSGSRTQVAICVLIKNAAHTGQAEILYRDIGDYLTREQKLDILAAEGSLEGTEWEAITPNEYGDWVNHRDEVYDAYQPIGDKASKGTAMTPGIFGTYSRGLATSRDAWCYNFSHFAVETNMRRMIEFYNEQLVASEPSNDPTQIAWGGGLKDDLKRKTRHRFLNHAVQLGTYRPFCKQFVYFSGSMNERQYQLPKLFPTPAHPNIALYLSSPGASKQFSPFITDSVPNLHLIHTGSAYSLYAYEPLPEGTFPMLEDGDEIVDGYIRRENVTDGTLDAYRTRYPGPALNKEDIFYYVYGLLHSPTYREAYKADLMKMLPRIPKIQDFWGFSTAGRSLAELHLNYESVQPHPLIESSKTAAPTEREDQFDFYRVNKMSFLGRKDRTGIVYNFHITLTGIPLAAYDYQVNGKSAIEWILDRYQVTINKESQILNDPNDFSREVDDPRYIIDLIARIVTVSLETAKIVVALPPLNILDENPS
ncbi:type ISP restriction/modification enzyme [Cryobacterium sp. MDB2-33-2]|uniref:DEAD/DEAH box helicase n=1 Tax=Cryobacterium sp. MDB2-33-2 TaxID=1259179 RepID=UPI001069BE2F|nr:type ISP restriction/modification enzyme [Cryobacterium sp. MDB2-33-2]TFC06547.1 DEAD/DEAH box helicase [Cryobacterium sp. MDB2-33-2]